MLAETLFSPVFSESPLQPSTRESKEVLPTKKAGLGILWHGILDQLKTTTTAIRERLLPHKEFTIWTSQRYFDAWALAQSPAEQEIVYKELDPDLESVFDEHSFNKLSVCYQYGPNGIRNGYSQSMVEIAENFLNHLKSLGLPTQRAELEVAVAKYATAWMANPIVQVGEKLVFISPRGTEAELYPGLKEENHVFVNILERKSSTEFVLHEFRNYDSHQELPRLQQRIAEKSAGFFQKITTTHPDYDTQHIITNFVHVPDSCALTALIDQIYLNKQKWKINIDSQIPKLREAVVQEQNLRVRQFCIEKFKQLAHETLSQSEKIAAFDLLFTLVRKELNKWVENNANNYDKSKQIEYTLHLDIVESVWQIQRKKQAGEKLVAQETSLLNKFSTMTQLNPALPLQKMTSLAHCIVGTPTSLLKIQTMSNLNPSLVSMSGFEANPFSQLSLEDRQNYITELKQYVRITLGGEVWYVPPEYLEGKGCYVDPMTGLAMGPCGLPLSDPRETNAKRESDYLAILRHLESASAVDTKLAALSQSQRERIYVLYFSLLKCLFVASASLERILHADILRPQREIKTEFTEVFLTLKQAFNPLPQLVLYLAEKAQFDQSEFESLESAALSS